MKRFEIITEADARVLPRGETVMLARGGHITPLAQDTLKERRITVVREGQRVARGRGARAARGHPDGRDRQRSHGHQAAAGARDVSPRPRPGRAGPRDRRPGPGGLS